MQSTSQIAWGIAIVLLVVYAIWWWQQRRKFRARQRAVQPQALSGAPTESAKPKPVPTVAIGVVRKRYEQQARTCAAEQQNCSLKLRELSAIDYNTWEPTELLKRANAEETANLVAILGLKPSDRDKDLVAELRSAGSHSIATLFRGGTPVPYAEVVTDVAKKLKVPDLTSDTLVAEVERQVVETLINMRLAKAEPEEREQMLRALGVARDGTGQALTMAAGGLVVANLSGFALYTAASSALAGVAGLFGVVLPFSVYTASSSLIATLIGPVGWVALIGITVITFGATNYKKTVPGVLCIATLRARLLAERQEEIQKIQAQKQRADLMMARLEPLRAFLDRHRELADDDPIPVSSVPGY